PSPSDMERIIAEDEALHMGQYYASKRHTIQVDFGVYCHDLMKEIERGAKRSVAAGNRLPVPAKADLQEA
ncbi:MAG: NAD(P)/FAD-dependent oxidoreductase, partial [Phenylobacterium sp.]